MAHAHHRHTPAAVVESTKNTYIVSIVLNLGFVLIEGVIGLTNNSYGLLSDAGHNLSDVFSLLLALVAFYLASPQLGGRYDRLSRHISFANALLLIVAVVVIAQGAVSKLFSPEAVDGHVVSITAGIGIVINGLTAWMLMRQNQKDLNNRTAYLHMLADTLVSMGVVISGLLINATGWFLIDPIISLLIAAAILISGIKLLLAFRHTDSSV